MQLRLIQTVSKIIIVAEIITSSLLALDVPMTKEATIEVPVGEYSIIKFPFKITKTQLGYFKGERVVTEDKKDGTPIALPENTRKITLEKNNNNETNPNKSSKKVSGTNILNIKKIDNIMTLRPRVKGNAEVILWGNKDFPLLLKIKVVEKDKGEKDVNFVKTLDSRDEVITFETSPHEKIIERIMQHLYEPSLHKKPSGYEEVIRKDVYDVGIKNRQGEIFARIRMSLVREVIGRRYVGQVWNANIVSQFDGDNHTTIIPKGFKLKLYDEMFDSAGVFAVSLETYSITQEHGTRVMIVRKKEGI